MKIVNICIPQNAEEGDVITFNINGQDLELYVTADMEPESVIQITLAGNDDGENELDNKSSVEAAEALSACTQDIEGKSNGLIKVSLGADLYLELMERKIPCLEGDGTCVVSWKAGEAMARFLVNEGRSLVEGKFVVELGAGLGTVGLAAALGGASHVILTDCQKEQLDENIALNRKLIEGDGSGNKVSSCVLKWGHSFLPEPKYDNIDIVVGSDILYDCEAGYEQLCITISELSATVLLGVRWRKPDKERTFFERMVTFGYHFDLISKVGTNFPANLKGLGWSEYGNPESNVSNEYLSQKISIGGKQDVPLYQVTEFHQNLMTDEEYINFENLQIQIYIGKKVGR